MSKFVYFAAKGAQFKAEDAQVLGETFEQIAERAELTPETVVDEARPEASPIHDFFEWDNDHAAENWRKQEARHYLTHLHIQVVKNSEPVRAFHLIKVVMPVKESEPDTDDADTEPEAEPICNYKHIDIITQNRDWMQQLIERERMALIGVKSRLSRYESIARITAHITNGPLQEAILQLGDLPVAV